MKLETPLAKARGLGSAKSGTGHWWWQRLTAIALVPLVIWLVWSLYAMAGADLETVRAWLARPLNSLLMVSTLIALFYHAQLGMQVVIEDYVHGPMEVFLQVAVRFICLILALAGILATIRISLGG